MAQSPIDHTALFTKGVSLDMRHMADGHSLYIETYVIYCRESDVSSLSRIRRVREYLKKHTRK